MPISVELRFGSTLSKNVIYVSIFELARASVMYFNRELDFLVGNNFFYKSGVLVLARLFSICISFKFWAS